MIITIDPAGPTPPYEQIRDQVVAGVRSGALRPGFRLPTVRQLAGDLGLAVNTVAKAYRQLESEGHVATLGRNGTVVRDQSGASGPNTPDEVEAAAVLLARAAQRAQLDVSAAIGALRRAW